MIYNRTAEPLSALGALEQRISRATRRRTSKELHPNRLRGPEPRGLASEGACIEHSDRKPHNNHASRNALMSKLKYVLAEPLGTCSLEPSTGITRDDNCVTGPQAIGSHTVCHLADLKCRAVDLS
jgi:hypothetical protein